MKSAQGRQRHKDCGAQRLAASGASAELPYHSKCGDFPLCSQHNTVQCLQTTAELEHHVQLHPENSTHNSNFGCYFLQAYERMICSKSSRHGSSARCHASVHKNLFAFLILFVSKNKPFQKRSENFPCNMH